MEPGYPITIYISKTDAAKKLGINRKTIQRKVKEKKLSQDSLGRVRRDELVALLRSEEMRGRRGPKTPMPKGELAQKIHHYDPNRGFVAATLEPTEAILLNQQLDEEAVESLMIQLASLSIASLEAVVKNANTLIEHKARLAKLGLIKSAPEIFDALEITVPSPP